MARTPVRKVRFGIREAQKPSIVRGMGFRLAWLLVLLSCCSAQQREPAGVLGDLLDWSGTRNQGELTFRDTENQVYECSFDEQTQFERDNQPAVLTAADRGRHVVVFPDHSLGTNACYIRTLRIVDIPTGRLAARRRVRSTWSPSVPDFLVPRGDLTFSGVVMRVGDDALLLRMRSKERKLVLLRPDTLYLGEGLGLSKSDLAVNTCVFVRAGRNLQDEVEAYQIIWGEILEPIIEPDNN